MRKLLFLIFICSSFAMSAQEKLQEKNDCFFSYIKNGSVDALKKERYNIESCLNEYDLDYIDCQFFLFMFEYAFRYNDGVAFQYLANFISNTYEKYNLTPDSLALDLMHRLNNRILMNFQSNVSNDSIALELKYKLDRPKDSIDSTMDIYRVICETFSMHHSDHKKTSILYNSLCNDMKDLRGRGNKIGQLFFLSFVIADQSKETLAYAFLYDMVCEFYLTNGLKINDYVFEIISSWISNLHSDNVEIVNRLNKLDSYKQMIMNNRSACD